MGAQVRCPSLPRDQTAVLSDLQPMAFVYLTSGPGEGREVTILHRLMKYMDMSGEAESGFHDHVLCLNGDILPHQYPIVDVPSTLFHLIGTPVRVLPSTEATAALIPRGIIRRCRWDLSRSEADPETEVVHPRNMQILPGQYAALLVHRRGVSSATCKHVTKWRLVRTC